MRTTSRVTMMLAGSAGVSLACAGVMAPGALAANTVDGDVSVSNTETVQVLMDASGKIDAKRVYEQLVLRGKGKVDIANPVSTKGLRNLDGFGGFDVNDGQVRVKTDVDGTKKYRSVSDFTKELPLDVTIAYTLNGKKIDPSDVVGRSGDLEVRYTVVNTTGTSEDVEFTDGQGETQTSTEDVVIPIVGSVTTTLPSTFTEIASNEANIAGDGRGGTTMSFTMTLIPPIGNAVAEFGYTAKVKDAVIPKASISALPVNPLESPSFKGGAASYQGGAETGQDLTAGATEIDANVLKLRDGANELVDGLLQLRDGADQLSTGLQGAAAPGAQKLADGAGKLDAGAGQLADGSGDLSAGAGKIKDGAGALSDGTGKLSAGADKLNQGADALSDGLDTASAGAPALLEGVAKLKAGAQQVDAGLLKLRTDVSAGGETFKSTFAGSVDSATAGVAAQLAPSVNGALDNLNTLVQASAATDDEKQTFAGNIAGTKTALNNGIKGALTGPLASGLKSGVNSGVDQITGGVSGGVGDPATSQTLRNGVAQLIGGLSQLETKGGELVTGLDKLAAGAGQLKSGTGDLSKGAGDLDAGAGQLAAGTGDLKAGADKLNAGAGTLKDGTGQLSTGAGTLAEGLVEAAEGSGKLAAGLDTAAEGAPALPEGADRLSKEGTSKLVEAGNATAVDYGLKYALIEAGAERASSAQPYGSPEGAIARTAFKFEIAGEDGSGSENTKRGIAAVVLLAAAGVLATVRRRGLI